jgi:sugar/nucleoside kinase (ribokinase family)
MFDLVVVGHFAIDSLLLPKEDAARQALGGAPTYVSLAARKLNAKVSVISKVGEDFPEDYAEWLTINGIDLSGFKRVKNAPTTRFVLRYENEERHLRLQSLAPPITPEEISDSPKARVIHVAPIANELSSDVVDKLRALTPILSLDPQGFVRRFDANGNVCSKPWKNPQVLEQIDLFKSSLGEVKIMTGLADLRLAMQRINDYGAETVIVTRGAKGAALLYDKRFYRIPACKPRVLLDSTGAGDAFIGAFLAEYLRERELPWCACVGSAAASFVVEGMGPSVFGEKKEVYQRASGIYEKGLSW